MKITEDVRKYAAEQGLREEAALKVGMEQKSEEFTEQGAELYQKASTMISKSRPSKACRVIEI